MNDNTEDTEWLNDFPALEKQSRENPFLVPKNYFEEQQENMRIAIFAEELKVKLSFNGFTIPPDYFKDMQEQVLSAIKLEEMRAPDKLFTKSEEFFDEQQSIITARLKINEYAEKGNGFSVPVDYFKQLTDQLNTKTGVKEAQQPAKIKNLFTRAAWKYATAACIAVAVTVGVFVEQHQSPAHDVQKQLSNLSDADIENYLKINADTYDNHVILENSTSDTESEIKNDQASTDSNETSIN